MTSWCDFAGHYDEWVTVGDYRVRVCRRRHCKRISAVITWRQWPTPFDDVIGWTVDTETSW